MRRRKSKSAQIGSHSYHLGTERSSALSKFSSCRSSQSAPVQDMINLDIKGRQLLLAVHSNGALHGWDLPSQKRVFAESLLADGLLDTTAPLRIAETPFNASKGNTLSSNSSAVNIAVLFGSPAGFVGSESNHQVSPDL